MANKKNGNKKSGDGNKKSGDGNKKSGKNNSNGKKGEDGGKMNGKCGTFVTKNTSQMTPKDKLEVVKRADTWYKFFKHNIAEEPLKDLAKYASDYNIPWDVRSVVENLSSMYKTIQEYAVAADTEKNLLESMTNTMQTRTFSNSRTRAGLIMPGDASQLPALFASGHLLYGFVDVRNAVVTSYRKVYAHVVERVRNDPTQQYAGMTVEERPIKLDFDYINEAFYMYFGFKGVTDTAAVVCRFTISESGSVDAGIVISMFQLSSHVVTGNFVTVIENSPGYQDTAFWNSLDRSARMSASATPAPQGLASSNGLPATGFGAAAALGGFPCASPPRRRAGAAGAAPSRRSTAARTLCGRSRSALRTTRLARSGGRGQSGP